ncbi:MAG TPA: hypothetical protein VN969_35510 [Streptosporangiaceae bacterium]|nr:hypothetical protein [Streptosporangiaceae bacterium]
MSRIRSRPRTGSDHGCRSPGHPAKRSRCSGPGCPAAWQDRAGTGTGPLPGLRSAGTGPRSAVRSWPLLLLAAPAAAEVWSGWVGIAARTGFGLVSPLPGIWPSLHIDTTITLPVGVEAYAAYALRAWLAPAGAVSPRTRRFARRSAIFSFTLGGAGQVAYHLLEQARITQAPWQVTTIVSCLPVLVLAMGTALAHMLHADAIATGSGPGSARDQRPDRSAGLVRADHALSAPGRADSMTGTGPPRRIRRMSPSDRGDAGRDRPHDPRTATAGTGQDRLLAARLIAAGQPVSRRALRAGGVRSSNEALSALAQTVNDELAAQAGRAA